MFCNSDTISCIVISKQTSTFVFWYSTANITVLNDISAPQRENGGAPSRQSSVSSPSRASLMLLCRQLAPFAISEDATIHRASPARSSHFPSTSLQEEHAAPSFSPVETSLDDNKADLERHLWNHYPWFTVSLFDRFDGHITLSTVWHFNLQE